MRKCGHASPKAGVPQAGEALLRIDRLALTTNNITYAAFGETPHLRYWDFFPTGAAEWFHMPAWGFAEIVESTVEGLAVGERFYGYWPIASHVVMNPVRVSERGFYDGIKFHRVIPDFMIAGVQLHQLWGPVGDFFDQYAPRTFLEGLNVNFYFGGTSLLIVVGVAMDTANQIEAQLIMRHYEGFTPRAGRIRGRRSFS